MHRKFIALIITATIAITGFSAAPARADADDLAKALAGIAALAIIGKASHDRRDRDEVNKRQHVHRDHKLKPRPLPKRAARNALPAQCLRQAESDRGQIRVFGARCLERNYRFANQLPRGCTERVWTQRGWRWAYGARCLRRQGFEVARY